MTKKIFALAALAVATTPAFAADLWNQQVGLPAQFNGAVDDQFTDNGFTQYSSYQASDVIVGSGGWVVTSISMEFLDGGSASAITQGVLNVFANNGSNSLPAVQNDPTAGSVVGVQITALGPIGAAGGEAYLMTASGLNLDLNAGEYWIGLTGITQFQGAGGQIQLGFSQTNSAGALHDSAWINPQGGWSSGTAWQFTGNIDGDPNQPHVYSAIDVQGTAAPEPASMALLGLGIVGLIRRRRNRN